MGKSKGKGLRSREAMAPVLGGRGRAFGAKGGRDLQRDGGMPCNNGAAAVKCDGPVRSGSGRGPASVKRSALRANCLSGFLCGFGGAELLPA